MSLKPKNLYKAWISTFIGALIGTTTTITTSLAEGKFEVKALYVGLGIAAVMGLTDVLKETKKELDVEDSNNIDNPHP